MKITRELSVAAAVSCMALFAGAETCVWTGGGADFYWNTSGNWQDGRKPADGDSVLIEVAPSQAAAITNDITGLELGDLRILSEGKGCDFEGNEVSVSGFASIALMSAQRGEAFKMALSLAEGSECVVTSLNKGVVWEGNLSGKGTFRKRGANTVTVQYCDNSAFTGDFVIEQGDVSVYALENPFGTGAVHIYGQDKTLSDSNSGTLKLYRNITLANDIHMWHHCSMYVFRTATLNGDIVCHTGHSDEHCRLAPYSETDKGVTYYGGIQINGKLSVDPDNKTGRVSLYTFNTNQWIRFAGGVDLANTSFLCSNSGTYYVASDIAPSTATLFPLVYSDHLVFEKTNALPAGGIITLGSNKTNANCVVDLNGFDQTCGIIYSLQPGSSYAHCTNNSQITSSSPAKITMTSVSASTVLPDLNGSISARIQAPATSTGFVTATLQENRECTMSGRLDVGGWTRLYLRSRFPNISELGVSEKCMVAMDRATGVAGFNPNATLDFHDLDTSAEAYDADGYRNRGYLLVSNFDPVTPLVVNRVYANNIDYPARNYYQREKNGARNGGVFWLQSGTGKVVVSDHVYHWVWTGGGDGLTIDQAANWGTNVAPSAALSPPVLDFRSGAPAGALALSGDIALAGISNTNATITVGGSGTIAMSGAETNSAALLFAGSVGVSYSGTGCQTFRSGVSTTTGSLAVNSGEVAFEDGFDWGGLGSVSILPSSGGRLFLGDGVHANAKELYVNGSLAYGGTWGSSVSSAKRRSDSAFAGAGDIRNLASQGIVVIVE